MTPPTSVLIERSFPNILQDEQEHSTYSLPLGLSHLPVPTALLGQTVEFYFERMGNIEITVIEGQDDNGAFSPSRFVIENGQFKFNSLVQTRFCILGQ